MPVEVSRSVSLVVDMSSTIRVDFTDINAENGIMELICVSFGGKQVKRFLQKKKKKVPKHFYFFKIEVKIESVRLHNIFI